MMHPPEPKPMFRKYLTDALEIRKARNGRYSLRAFAKHLEIDASSLSKILSGKLSPSPRLAIRLVERLKANPEEQRMFIESVCDTKKMEILKSLGMKD